MAGIKRLRVHSTNDDFSGFDYLTAIHAAAQNRELDQISLDMGGVGWFSTVMSAPLLVLTRLWKDAGASVAIDTDPMPDVRDALCRNGFLCYFGRQPVHDGYNTSIPLTLIPTEQDRRGAEFLSREVMAHRYFPPNMSDRYRRSLLTNFGEVFINVRQHAATQNLATCGQYFPKQNRLAIVVADGGATIPRNVRRHLGITLSDVDAVEWAMARGNTTRESRLGGDGLWNLREFVASNRGSLTIASASAYWSQRGDNRTRRLLGRPFPGTCVYWEIVVGDEGIYRLDDE